MKRYTHFWFATLVRGFLAIIFGSAILIVPEMARTILLLPFALTIAIVGLAAYGVLDSALVAAMSFMSTHERVRLALRMQGMVGILLGIALLTLSNHVAAQWFLLLAGTQAGTLAIAEYTVASHDTVRSISSWNFVGSAIATCFALVYLFIGSRYGRYLGYDQITWLTYAYLLTVGFAQVTIGARMLYAGDHGPQPPSVIA